MQKIALGAAAALTVLVVPAFAALVSSYSVSGRNANGSTYTAAMKFAPVDQIYRVDSEDSSGKMSGIVIEYKNFLALAEAKDNEGYLAIYKRTDDSWFGVFSDYSEGPLSAEVLYNGSTPPDVPNPPRAAKLAGKYLISGTNPDGTTYSGEVEVSEAAERFEVDRMIGNKELRGSAVALDGAFAMNVNENDYRAPIGVLGLFIPEANGFVGVWVASRSQRLGAERWVRR